MFSAAVHIAASGHSLGFIPVLCVLGGWVLARVVATRGRRVGSWMVAAALLLNVTFFFKPYSKQVKEASYKTVGIIRGINESTLDRIDAFAANGETFLVSDGEWVSWRTLEYYYPTSTMIYLPAPSATPENPPPVWKVRNRARVQDLDPKSELTLPGCGTIVWMVSDGKSRQDLLAVEGADVARYFVATPVKPGMHFQVGRYRLATSPEPCSQRFSLASNGNR